MKKFLAIVMAAIMVLSVCLTATAELAGEYDITIWAAENAVDLTKKQVEDFNATNTDGIKFNATVEPVSESEAATQMITDVEAGADIFSFASDQFARLVQAGALAKLGAKAVEFVTANNVGGSVAAVTSGDTMYAYPMTADNGYFMFYDKSIIPEEDAGSLDKIIADCEAAGKNFYMEINSGWYQTAFFFGTGCTLTYDTDENGGFTACNIDYASDKGLVALKEMIKLKSSPSFQNGSAAGETTNLAAIVDGTWDMGTVQELFGDNFACAKLPSFTGSDGKTYQMSGFSGYKLLGVKPQEDEDKLAACDALAYYLAGEEVQLARYDAVQWGPSNLNAQKSDAVASNPALQAVIEQMALDVPQGQYPGEYWSLATGLGDDVIQGNLKTDSSDDELMAALQTFQDTCISYAG